MFNHLLAAGAVLSALALAFAPMPFSLAGAALCIIALGIMKAKREPLALVPTALALAGLLMIGLALTPANAAPAKAPILTTLELPAAAPMLALPSQPAAQTIVVASPNPETSVSLPIGEWLKDVATMIQAVLLAALAFVLRKAPAPIVWLVKMYGEQKLVEMAVNIGINAVPGAAKGEPMTVDVGSKVLASALQWAVNEVPGIILKIAGGEDGLKAKIFAALHLDAEASAADLGVNTTG